MDKKVLHDISYGLYAVTTRNENIDSGCIINTLTQITSVNPIVSISLNKDNYTNEMIKKSNLFAVSIISEETSKESISKFGYFSSRDTDKFSDVDYIERNNIKVFNDNICGYMLCEVINCIDTETHDIFLGRVISSEKVSDKKPMTYKYYREELKGTSPKNAPTFEEVKNEDSEYKKYRCTVCGYIYDDKEEKIKFADLPEDWKCPICGVGKDAFKEVF